MKAWSYALDRFLLLYNDNGIVVGPATLTSMSGCLFSGSSSGLLPSLPSSHGSTCGCALYRLVMAAVSGVRQLVRFSVIPALFQRFFVKPSELQLEAPYIQRNIALTREAYNLRQITVKPFPAEQGLSFQSLQDNSGTIDNIRLWDWQPLMDTYAQLQEIRTYYKFLDVDIDRYQIDGAYQQVTLAARELAPVAAVGQCPDLGQPASPVHPRQRGRHVPGHPKTAEGLPNFYLKDIPPVASGGPGITEPRIYFGQGAVAT